MKCCVNSVPKIQLLIADYIKKGKRERERRELAGRLKEPEIPTQTPLMMNAHAGRLMELYSQIDERMNRESTFVNTAGRACRRSAISVVGNVSIQ